MNASLLGSCLALVALQASPVSAWAGWVYQHLYVADSFQTRATDINNSGAIVGYYQPSGPSAPGESGNKGFIVQNGVMTSIPITDPWGINNSGVVVGQTLDNGIARGQILKNGLVTMVDYPGSIRTELWDINDAGIALGTYGTSTSHNNWFTYLDGTFTTHDAYGNAGNAFRIDNAGNVYGVESISGKNFVLAPDGTVTSLTYEFPGSIGTTTLWGANSVGQVVGFGTVGITDRSFVYQDGTFTPLDYPGTPQTAAYGINDDGTVVGLWWDFAANRGHGFVASWDSSGGPGLPVSEPPVVLLAALALALLANRYSAVTRREHEGIR